MLVVPCLFVLAPLPFWGTYVSQNRHFCAWGLYLCMLTFSTSAAGNSKATLNQWLPGVVPKYSLGMGERAACLLWPPVSLAGWNSIVHCNKVAQKCTLYCLPSLPCFTSPTHLLASPSPSKQTACTQTPFSGSASEITKPNHLSKVTPWGSGREETGTQFSYSVDQLLCTALPRSSVLSQSGSDKTSRLNSWWFLS